jgi:3-dehydroquinate synthase
MRETTLTVDSGSGGYEVRIGAGLLDRMGDAVRAVSHAPRAALVADSNVMRLFGERAGRALEGAGLRVVPVEIPAGETSKSWERAGAVIEAFSESGIARDDVVIALGGGVVGDLAGFCAATYMRGVGVVQVPTTLLAQVDSSIGGKTGVDLPRGKNLAGAFWAPLAVVADTATLSSLVEAEWTSGLAEVAKSAILDGEPAVGALFGDSEALSRRDPGAVEMAVIMAASLKVRTVSADERESDARESLNLGHTLGHAIEKVAGYGAVAHGAAVAEGMRFAARVAERMEGVSVDWTARQDLLLSRLGLGRSGCAYPPEALLEAMRSDKKVRAGEVRMVLSRAPGDWVARSVPDEILVAELVSWCGAQRRTEEGAR